MIKTYLRKFSKLLIITLAVTVILFAVLVNVTRFVLPNLEHKREFFTRWASNILHLPVSVQRVKLRWHYYDPIIDLTDVVVTDKQHHKALLQIKHLSISINVLHSLLNGALLPSHLTVSGTQLEVSRQADGTVKVNGIVKIPGGQHRRTSLGYFRNILLWMLTQSEVRIKNVNIHYHTSVGQRIIINNFHMDVLNSLLKHRIKVSGEVAQSAPTRFGLTAVLHSGDLGDTGVDADVTWDIKHLVFKQWLQSMHSGVADVVGGMKIRNGSVQHIDSLVHAKKIQWQTANTAVVKLPALQGRFVWQHQRHGWQLHGQKLHAVLNHHHLSLPSFLLHVAIAHPQQYQIKLALPYLHAADIAPVLQAAHHWPANWQRIYAQLQPQGELRDVLVQFDWGQQGVRHYLLQSQFTDFSLQAYRHLPALNHLNGSLVIAPQYGKLQLNAQHVNFQLKQIFRHSIVLPHLAVDAQWHRDATHPLTLKVSHFNLSDGNVHWQGKFNVITSSTTAPTVHLSSQITAKNASEIRRWVPRQVISTGLQDWLRQAFLAGEVTQGRIDINGVWGRQLLLQKTDGLQVNLDIHHAKLRYAKYWPTVDGIDGQLSIQGAALLINATRASICGNALQQTQVKIANLFHPILTASAVSQGQLSQGFDFLRASPLSFVKHLQAWKMGGDMQLQLKLQIPLAGTKAEKKVDGLLSMQHASMEIPSWGVNLTALQGQLHFVNDRLTAKKILGLLHQQPITIALSTTYHQQQPTYSFAMGGDFDTTKLPPQSAHGLVKRLQGKVNYRALLTVANQPTRQRTRLSVLSSLQGLAVKLPAPLAKAADSVKLFKLSMSTENNQPVTLMLRYGQSLSMAMQLRTMHQRQHLVGAVLHLGNGLAQPVTQPGLVVTGKLAKFDWSVWRPYFQPVLTGLLTHRKVSGLPLHEMVLDIDQFNWNQYNFVNTKLHLTSLEQAWQVVINNNRIKGELQIPKQPGAVWQGHFHYLNLPSLQRDSQPAKPHIHHVPAVDLHIDDFRYADAPLGALVLKTRTQGDAMEINQFALSSSAFRFIAQGRWQQQAGRDVTVLSGGIGAKNMGGLLRAWGLSNVLSGARGAVNFNLKWQDQPLAIAMKSVKGAVHVDLYSGRITHLSESAENKLGIGRILNLLSLQALPENIFTGFNTVRKKGFKFDHLTASFNLRHGLAKAVKLSLDGPVAWVRAQGAVNFIRKSYDLKLQVMPNVTSSLPLIATIAGGPLAGAITWFANKIIAAPLIGKAIKSRYHVTGQWQKPNVATLPAGKR